MSIVIENEEEVIAQCAELYDKGYSINQISQIVGHSTHYITKVIKGTGRKIDPKYLFTEQKMEIYRLYNEGMPIEEICRLYTKSEPTIIRAIYEVEQRKNYKSYAKRKEEEGYYLPHVQREVVKKVVPEPIKDGLGCIVGFDVSFLYGVECPNICKIPGWKLKLEREGKVNFGYGCFGTEAF